MRRVFPLLAALLLGACAAPVDRYDRYYSPVSPADLPPREQAELVDAGEDADALYRALFAEHEVVGRLDFTEIAARPGSFVGYAKKVGADLALVSWRFVEREERTDYEPYQAPVQRYRRIRTPEGKVVYDSYVDYETRFRLVTRRYDIHAQKAIFLREGLAAPPFSAPPRETVGAPDPMGIVGLWENTRLRIRIFRSNGDYAAVLEALTEDGREAMEDGPTTLVWAPGDAVLSFDAESRSGWVLNADKAPRPAEFAINRFGYLEADVPDGYGAAPSISFKRVE